MKVLITGASGFVGRHMAAELLRAGHEIVLTGVEDCETAVYGYGTMPVGKLDITNPDECLQVMQDVMPDAVVHLAGIAQTVGHTPEAFEAINVIGARQTAEAYKRIKSTKKIFLFVGSAYVYGGDIKQNTLTCDESTKVVPRGPYGESKLRAEKEVLALSGEGLDVYVARPFNHIGPGQDLSFVVPGLAKKVNAAAPGSQVETGNLNALRDFTDVRDVVRAYRLILEKKPDEKIFVIGSGRPTVIKDIFEFFAKISGKNISSYVSNSLRREESSGAILANAGLARRILGWVPEITLHQSLRDVWHEQK